MRLAGATFPFPAGFERFRCEAALSFRVLARSKVFLALALCSIAPAIGLLSAVSAVLQSVLSRPLPLTDPARLVFIWGSKDADVARGISPETFAQFHTTDSPFSDAAAFAGMHATEVIVGGTGAARAFFVTPNFFRVLGVAPVMGSDLRAEGTSGGPAAVMVSHEFWRNQLHSGPSAVGKVVLINGNEYRVAGVMPSNFFFPAPRGELWMPLPDAMMSSPKLPSLNVVARLRTSASIPQAGRWVDWTAMRSATVAGNRAELGMFPVEEVLLGKYRTGLRLLLAGAFVLLLLSAVNGAHLFLVRFSQRLPQMAICHALGADIASLVRTAIIESVYLGLMCGLAGAGLGAAGLHALLRQDLTNVPRVDAARLGVHGLATALGSSIVVSLLCAGPTVARLLLGNLHAHLRRGSAAIVGRSSRMSQDGFLVAEIVVSFVLIVGASLLVQSSARLARVGWGFNPRNLVVVDAQLPGLKPLDGAAEARILDTLRRLRSVPGVESVGVASGSPIINYSWRTRRVKAPGGPAEDTREWIVGPGYFQAMGIPLVEGNGFAENRSRSDGIVIEKALAERLWPGGRALGQPLLLMRLKSSAREQVARLIAKGQQAEARKIAADPGQNEPVGYQVAGVVGPVKLLGPLPVDSEPSIYVDYRSRPVSGPLPFASFFVRSRDGSVSARAVADAVSAAAPELTVLRADKVEDRVSAAMGDANIDQLLLAATLFGGLVAVSLAAGGIYSIFAFSTCLRRREIGVRIALGAQPSWIRLLVVRRALLLAALGSAAGWWLAARVTDAFRAYLFDIRPDDAGAYSVIAVAFLLVAAGAAYLPARRMSMVGPCAALRAGDE